MHASDGFEGCLGLDLVAETFQFGLAHSGSWHGTMSMLLQGP